MIVYGERTRRALPAELVEGIAAGVTGWESLPPGIERHSRIVTLLLDAGELAQGLADRAFGERGLDGADAPSEDAMALCTALAHALVASWRTGFAGRPPDVSALLAALRTRVPREVVEVRVPEGYAHYAVYPECYAEAATELAGKTGVRVIGIRSIGTSLSAVLAAALGAEPPVTVRPVGHPFARRLALAPELLERLRPRSREPYAIVDEGPGLSGSSFLAVGSALEAAGVPPERVHLFPSHPGDPGMAATDEARRRWQRWPRHHVPFEAVALREEGLAAWLADVTGPPDGPPEDLGAGRWRALAFAANPAWPPVFRQQERRKYLVTAGGKRWLAEFVGLGRLGEGRCARARALAAEGHAPPCVALRHGFLVRRWVEGTPLPLARLPVSDLVGRLAGYLSLRARRFGAGPEEGASPDALLDMLQVNAAEALGPDSARQVRRFVESARAAARDARRIAVDGKLEAWEWLVLPGGELSKLDAVQHADGHDLVGCQDVAWDVAGATVELGLDADAAGELARRVRHATGAALAPPILAFYEAAYLAFRVGRWTLALASETDREERARIERILARYTGLLRSSVEGARQTA
jgi:hypothetical protein